MQRHRASRGAADRRGHRLARLRALRGRQRADQASAARPVGAAEPAPGWRFAAGSGRVASAARRQRLCRSRRHRRPRKQSSRSERARALRAAARPHEGGAGAGWLAAGLRIHGQRRERALRAGVNPGGDKLCAADPAADTVQSARRLLRAEPAGSRRGRGRHPQRRGQVEQGAARQRGAALRRAGL